MPYGSGRTWKCRECDGELSGKPHLMLGRRLKGSNLLCLMCADTQGIKHHTHFLEQLVPAYVKANQEASETARLRQEVQELRTMLEQLTDPAQGVNGAH